MATSWMQFDQKRFGGRLGILCVVICSVLPALRRSAVAADVLVGESVPAVRRVAMSKIDHGLWDSLLQKYVDDRGMVSYRKWKASGPSVKQLDDYIAHLSTAKLTKASKAEHLAFWINAYNAVTIKGILREYPTSSIRNHTAKLWGYNIWKNLKLQVDAKQLSLDEIEHKILRTLDEPRIHFAIVCASIGCPKLLNRAYLPEKIQDQLADNARDFFADPAKFKRTGNKLQISPILKWFGEDFGSTQAAQLKAIAPYLPKAAQAVAKSGNANVSYLGYDWGLNDKK
ncbi:MAG: DUF547 domain-containing protein [Aureliella sp.]